MFENQIQVADQTFHPELPLSLIDDHPLNPRIHAAALIEGSLRAHQFYGGIIVVQNPEDSDRYLMVAGHGRLNAFDKAGNSTIPAFEVHNKTPDQVLAMLLDDNGVSDRASLNRKIFAQAAAAIVPGTKVATIDAAQMEQLRIDANDVPSANPGAAPGSDQDSDIDDDPQTEEVSEPAYGIFLRMGTSELQQQVHNMLLGMEGVEIRLMAL